LSSSHFRYQQSPSSLLISIARRTSFRDSRNFWDAVFDLSNDLEPYTIVKIFAIFDSMRDFYFSPRNTQIKGFLENYLKDFEYQWRLPGESIPLSYDLHLKTNIHTEDVGVEGEVTIKLKVLETTDQLILHSRNLVMNEMKLFDVSGREIGVISNAFNDILTIITLEEIAAGSELTLNIKYNFEMNEGADMTGLYRTYYSNEARELK
jgi:hypothetical protein